MIRHTQQILGDPARGDGHDTQGRPGDCWKTCIASILDLPMEAVPHFVESKGDWWAETRQFIDAATDGTKEILWWEHVPNAPHGIDYFIATGDSPRGDFQHAVIANSDGQIIHDPHPSRAGLVGPATQFFGLAKTGTPADKLK